MWADALAITVYCVATWRLATSLRSSATGSALRFLEWGWLALVLHILALADVYQQQRGLDLNVVNVGALASALLVFVLLTAALTEPVAQLGVLVLPVAALALLLKTLLQVPPQWIDAHAWPVQIHIVSSMLAFSLFAAAAVQAGVLALQERRLRHHAPPPRWLAALPALETMERLLFKLITAGLVLLSIGLASGAWFIRDLLAQHLAHKTILSCLAWIMYAMLLVGRQRWGWRGTVAVRYCLTGFFVLLLAYFGSKLALELMLGRSWH